MEEFNPTPTPQDDINELKDFLRSHGMLEKFSVIVDLSEKASECEDIVSSLQSEVNVLSRRLKNEEVKNQDLMNEISDLEYDVTRLERRYSDRDGEFYDLKEKISPFNIKTLEDEMKFELILEVYKKTSLNRLEELVGNKFNLKV